MKLRRSKIAILACAGILSILCAGVAFAGDIPLHEEHAKFVLEGTRAPYIVLISVSKEEMSRIMSDSSGASGFNPVISLTRGVEGPGQPKISAEAWEPTAFARLINLAEVQYEIANGGYADYATLIRSGQLEKTGGREFTVVPGNLHSGDDPLPIYLFRVSVSSDRSSYQFSIREKSTTDCRRELFGDETGIVFEGAALGCRKR